MIESICEQIFKKRRKILNHFLVNKNDLKFNISLTLAVIFIFIFQISDVVSLASIPLGI